MFKPMMTVLALILAVPAFAAESQLLLSQDGNGRDYNGFEYNVNLSLNRAWVELNFDTRDSEGGYSTEDVAKFVRGLYFEPASQEVRYNNGRGITICATRKVERFLGIFPHVEYEATGRCTVQLVRTSRSRDDGMHNPIVTPVEKYYFTIR
jgi:hypothetical protein